MTSTRPQIAAPIAGPGPGRLAAYLRARDPGLVAVRRSVRAAVVMPAAFALGTAVTDDIQVALFASFGALSLLLFVRLGGSRAERLRGYTALVAVAVLLIILGTLCSNQVVPAVAAMAVIGFGVLFAGLLTPLAALGGMYLLMAFVLPVSVAAPPGQILPRLAGWLIGAAMAVPAILLVWPVPWHDDRRTALAEAARRLADLAQAHAEGRRDIPAFGAAQEALRRLRDSFDATSYRPTGTGPGEMALAKMVSRAEWVGALSVVRRDEAAGLLGLPHVRVVHGAVAGALRAIAVLVERGQDGAGRGRGGAGVAALTASLRTLHESREISLGAAVDHFVAEATGQAQEAPAQIGPAQAGGDVRVLAFVDPSFHARALGFATEMLGVLALEAAGVEHPDPADPAARPMTRRQAVSHIVHAHLTPRSVWLRNSLRGAVGLAAAVAVAKVTDISHGFWVVLGAISVLRSNAVGTGRTAMSALAGTVVGFVIGTAVMVGLGSHVVVLWLVLPVAVFVAALAPAVIPFAAGQAGFTVAVVILFNILVPAGWSVGLVRVEDVAIGCAVAVVVGFLMWPRGAGAAFGRALCDAYATSSGYLLAAVERLTSPSLTAATRPARERADAAYQRMDDAFRQFIGERGAKIISLHTATNLVTGAVRLRLAAHSLATLPLRLIDGERSAAAMTAAVAELRRACIRADAWYLGFAEVLADVRRQVPPVDDDHDLLHRHLLNAFETARASRDAAQVRLVLRLLWADEDLEDERALQHELARTAQDFAGQSRRRLVTVKRRAGGAKTLDAET